MRLELFTSTHRGNTVTALLVPEHSCEPTGTNGQRHFGVLPSLPVAFPTIFASLIRL